MPWGTYTIKNLKDHGLYYKQPAASLVFMTRAEHSRLHGCNMSEDAKRRIAEAHRGRPRSDETRRKISKSKGKTVQQFGLDGTFIKEWSSAKEAAEHVDKTDKFLGKKISKCCRGVTRTSRGFVWKYA